MGNCGSEKREEATARAVLAMLAKHRKQSEVSVSVVTWGQYPIINLTELEKAKVRQIGLEGKDLPWNESFATEDNPECPQNKMYKKYSESSQGSQPHSFHCRIDRKGQNLTIQLPQDTERKQIWQFLLEKCQIKERDRFRLGRSVYELVRVVLDSSLSVSTSSTVSASQSLYNPAASGHTCRICLSSTQMESDPLVSPCLCMGTIQYTHLKCLGRWLFGSQSQQGHIRVHRSVCELCQTDMTASPAFQKLQQNLTESLHEIHKPYAVFLVHARGKKSSSYFMMNLAKKKTYAIGRSSKADICDTLDFCISKIHAQLTFSDNKLYLQDCDSTHGTLVTVKQSLEVPKGQVKSLVYRNILLQICNS